MCVCDQLRGLALSWYKSSSFVCCMWLYSVSCDVCRFECGPYKESGDDIFTSRTVLSPMTSTTDSTGPVCLQGVVVWLERLLTALDCYSWIFGQNLLTPSLLLTGLLPRCLVVYRVFVSYILIFLSVLG